MNIGFWLCGVLVIPFVIIGVLFAIFKERAAKFVSGFNSLPKEEQALYDKAYISRDIKNQCFTWAGIMLVGAVLSYFLTPYMAGLLYTSLPLTSRSFVKSWPMTNWSLTASEIGKRRCSLSSRTLRKPIISLLLWPFRRCSICCARGPIMFTEAACPTMYGCCGTRPPTQGRFPSLKR